MVPDGRSGREGSCFPTAVSSIQIISPYFEKGFRCSHLLTSETSESNQTMDRLGSPPILSMTVEMPGRFKIMPMNGTRRRKETAAGMNPLLAKGKETNENESVSKLIKKI